MFALYIRDRWRVTPKLTLNLGLRWELYPNRTRSAGLGIESYDPTTNEVLVGGRGGIPQDNGVGYSKKLFAPRVGFAYQLDNSTVIRSGYGITFHSHPWGAQALRGWYPLTIVAVFSGVNGYQPVTTDPNYVAAGVPNQPLGPTVGIPPICCPDISKGRIPLPSSNEMGYPVANQELHRGYIQSWNFIVERKLPAELVASVGYVGTASVNGFAFLDINASQIPGSGNDGRPLFAKFGRTATTREWDGRTHSNYHSLQATINRRVRRAACSSRAPTPTRTPSTWPTTATGRRSAGTRRACSIATAPRRRTTSRTSSSLATCTSFPSATARSGPPAACPSAILGGWQFNGVFSAYQGRQFTLSASGASLNMPGNAQTPDQVKPTVDKLGKVGDDGTWFDTTAFARVTGVRFGTVGRNTMRGPGVVNTDLSLFRTFKLTERVNLQFRAESFNLSNTPHFANPNGNANSSNFGRITATQSAADAVGRSRELRFGLRLGF